MTSRMSSVRGMYVQQTSYRPINSIGQHFPIDFMGLLLVRKLVTLNKSHLFLLFPCYCQNVASQSFPKVAILHGKILRYCYILVLFYQIKKFTAKISPKISRVESREIYHVKNLLIMCNCELCFLRLNDKKTFDGKCFLVKNCLLESVSRGNILSTFI